MSDGYFLCNYRISEREDDLLTRAEIDLISNDSLPADQLILLVDLLRSRTYQEPDLLGDSEQTHWADPKRLGRTARRIRFQSSLVDSQAGHWIWLGASQGVNRPVLRQPGTHQVVGVRNWVLERINGYRAPKNAYIKNTCGVDNCVRPEHLEVHQRGQLLWRHPYAWSSDLKRFLDPELGPPESDQELQERWRAAQDLTTRGRLTSAQREEYRAIQEREGSYPLELGFPEDRTVSPPPPALLRQPPPGAGTLGMTTEELLFYGELLGILDRLTVSVAELQEDLLWLQIKLTDPVPTPP